MVFSSYLTLNNLCLNRFRKHTKTIAVSSDNQTKLSINFVNIMHKHFMFYQEVRMLATKVATVYWLIVYYNTTVN